jgi:hypothetical protein
MIPSGDRVPDKIKGLFRTLFSEDLDEGGEPAFPALH